MLSYTKNNCLGGSMTLAALTENLVVARRKVVTDGYEMSVGEVASLYKSGELVIDPNYQRLFRWEESQKTRFIESLLLGIPVPPIFVFQRDSGVWELIDGLQRISTILQLMGELRSPDGGLYDPLELGGTNLLPGLDGMKWSKTTPDDPNAFDIAQQLEIKRSRLRVEILRKESDEDAKFELFQRLNTGGTKLSEQEVRNSVLVMLNSDFYYWLRSLTEVPSFQQSVSLTPDQRNEQQHVEIALRFIAYRRCPYIRGRDVNEYLDFAARQLAGMPQADRDAERELLEWTFSLLVAEVDPGVFKRWNGAQFAGKFLISGFDAIAYGVAVNRQAIEAMDANARNQWLLAKVKEMWSEHDFQNNSGQGVRGTTRLTNLLPFGAAYFAP
jgi:hypothetical protein